MPRQPTSGRSTIMRGRVSDEIPLNKSFDSMEASDAVGSGVTSKNRKVFSVFGLGNAMSPQLELENEEAYSPGFSQYDGAPWLKWQTDPAPVEQVARGGGGGANLRERGFQERAESMDYPFDEASVGGGPVAGAAFPMDDVDEFENEITAVESGVPLEDAWVAPAATPAPMVTGDEDGAFSRRKARMCVLFFILLLALIIGLAVAFGTNPRSGGPSGIVDPETAAPTTSPPTDSPTFTPSPSVNEPTTPTTSTPTNHPTVRKTNPPTRAPTVFPEPTLFPTMYPTTSGTPRVTFFSTKRPTSSPSKSNIIEESAFSGTPEPSVSLYDVTHSIQSWDEEPSAKPPP